MELVILISPNTTVPRIKTYSFLSRFHWFSKRGFPNFFQEIDYQIVFLFKSGRDFLQDLI